MTIYVDHDYIGNYGAGDCIYTLSAAVPSNNGIVTVLMDKRAEQARNKWTSAEFDEFCRLKNEMEKLFAVGEARFPAKQLPPVPANSLPTTKTVTQAMKNAYPQGHVPNPIPSAWLPKQSSFSAQGQPTPTPVYTGPTQLPPPPATGFSCRRCHTFNDYAMANQPDGSYVCFGCRP